MTTITSPFSTSRHAIRRWLVNGALFLGEKTTRAGSRHTPLRQVLRNRLKMAMLSPRNTGAISGRLNITRNGFHHAFVEYGRNDVVALQFAFGNECGDRIRRGEFHLFVDP